MIDMLSVGRTSALLARGDVSASRQLAYFIAASVLAITITQHAMWTGRSPHFSFWLEYAFLIVISVLGIRHWWTSNGSGEGRDFILRSMCISVPLTIYMFLVQIVVGWILGTHAAELFGGGFFRKPEHVFNAVWYGIMFGIYIAYWACGARLLAAIAYATRRQA